MAMLTLDDALRITAAAQAKAGEFGAAVTVTVVDGGGSIRAQHRMDGAPFGTLKVSVSKAYTAAAFGAPTAVFTDLVQPGQSLFGFADAAGPIATFGGGLPLVRDGELVGGIGISGGSVDQDQEVAGAGAAAL